RYAGVLDESTMTSRSVVSAKARYRLRRVSVNPGGAPRRSRFLLESRVSLWSDCARLLVLRYRSSCSTTLDDAPARARCSTAFQNGHLLSGTPHEQRRSPSI